MERDGMKLFSIKHFSQKAFFSWAFQEFRVSGSTPAGLLLFVACFLPFTCEADEPPNAEWIVVRGAPGTDEYAKEFSSWVSLWRSVATEGAVPLDVIGESTSKGDREALEKLIRQKALASSAPLCIVLIGHGTYANQVAKFNLRGPDVSANELSQWLSPFKRPVVVVNCSSTSSPFINELSGKQRIIVTATQSVTEQNYARFGKFFVEAITSPEADLDHDDEVSLQEVFLKASEGVKQFYKAEDRISTEHALIDDNGDGLGTPARMFRGVRAIENSKPAKKIDGLLASRIILFPSKDAPSLTNEELLRREQLENEIESLRQKKASMDKQVYYDQLEVLMIKLATIYDEDAAEN